MKGFKLLTALIAVTAIIFCIHVSALTAAELEEAAIKEGKVVWYGAWPKPLMDKVAKAFKVHYPDIDVRIFRSGTSKVAAKFSAEKEAGATLSDIFTASDLSIYMAYKKKGFLEKYTPEEFNKFGEQFRDSDGFWVTPRIVTVGIWYNVDGLKKAGLDPPASWRDLANPKYKGKIVFGSPLYSGTFIATVGYFVNQEGWGWDFWKEVAANDVLFINDAPDVARTVSVGTREIGPCVWGYISMFPLHPKGTVKVVAPKEGVIAIQSPSGLVKGGPNPNAGKLFYKFLMSKEVAELITGDTYYSGRLDVAPPTGMPALTEIKTVGVDRAWLKEHKREINKKWTQVTGNK